MSIFNAFDNIFGGHDYTVDNHNYHSEDNIFGGENIYEDGRFVGRTESNIFGGEDYYDQDNFRVGSSHENIFGGEDFFSANGHYEGGIFETSGGMGFFGNGSSESFSINEMGNATTILGYSDPLSHVGSYILPTMIL